MAEPVKAGDPAPDFTLANQNGKPVSLADLRGQTVVLVFFPFDFSPVCTDQLSLYQELLSEFEARGAKLYGVSIDHAYAHKAFQEKLGISIPLLADFEPKGKMASDYGVYIDGAGFCKRAIVIIDPEGTVKFVHVEPSLDEIPAPNLIFDALTESG